MKRILLSAFILVALASCGVPRERTCWRCIATYNEPPVPTWSDTTIVCGEDEEGIRDYERRWTFSTRAVVEGQVVIYGRSMQCH